MNSAGWSSTAVTAETLGVTPRTVYSLANAGELVGYKIGRVYRWRNDDIADFLDRHRIRPGDLDHLLGNDDVEGVTSSPTRTTTS